MLKHWQMYYKIANIGGFEVKTLLDEPSYKVNEEIQAFFSDRGRDDLLLLYFSCHGIKDEEGQLYFATSNTSRKLLDATAISANFVNRMMFRSRSRRQLYCWIAAIVVLLQKDL